MRRGFRIALTGLHVINIRAVIRGDDGGDPVQFFRFGNIDGFDVGAGEGRADDMQAPGVFGNLVFHEDRFTGDQCGTVDLAGGLADDVQVRTEGRSDLALKCSRIPQFAGQFDREVIMFVPGVTDEDAAQSVFDLFAGRVRMIFQQFAEDQRCRGCVIGALHDACRDHGFLDVVQFASLQQGFRGADLRVFRLIEQDQVGVAQFSVKDDGVGPGKAFRVIAVPDGIIAGAVKHIAKPLGGCA